MVELRFVALPGELDSEFRLLNLFKCCAHPSKCIEILKKHAARAFERG
jgi:hypothetical protein